MTPWKQYWQELCGRFDALSRRERTLLAAALLLLVGYGGGALLVQPSILILDDATSSVDVETETRIQEAMREWTRDSTAFVVAQRISTVLRADKIVVVDEGRVVAQGTHAELMESSPVYQEIYDSQLGDGAKLQEKA